MIESPLIMGHEASGTVVATGSAVTSLAVGDKVAIEPGLPCRRCGRCKSGNYHFCSAMRFAASPPNTHGTLTKFYKSSEDFCYKLPESLSLQEGVLVEPLSVAVHAVKLAKIQPGSEVVIFGAGPVGLLCTVVANAFGASKSLVVDILEDRLAFAAQYGACKTYNPSDNLDPVQNATRMIKEHKLGNGAGAAIVIDASGAESCIQTGIEVLQMGGTYVQTGMGKPNIIFPIMAMCTKELMVRGCFRYGPGDYQLALDLLRDGKISLLPLISSIIPFEKATEAWETTRRGEGIKTLIQAHDSD